MQKLLSSDLWKESSRLARKATSRKAAIAYVTRDLLGFRKGDVLVVNASRGAISAGETDAKLLRRFNLRGVRLYHCSDLHAKVLLLDNTAVVGSANMSTSSVNALVEAGVITDHGSITAGVASLIEQLVQQSEQLTPKQIDSLCKIKVIRRGGIRHGRRKLRKTTVRRLGNRTWLVGVKELAREPAPEEKRMIDKAGMELRLSVDELSWLRWGGRGQFARECCEGDSLVEIWRSKKAKRPSAVLRAVPVLLVQRTKRTTLFYFRRATGSHSELPWGKFKRLLKKLGYPRKVSPGISHLVDPETADAIERNWKSSAKS